jgi:HEAT repeat protein
LLRSGIAMKATGKSQLLISVLLVSGCFQEVAPRHESPAVATAETAAQRDMARRSLEKPAQEATAAVPQLAMLLNEATDPEVRREAVYLIADAGELDDAAVIGQSLYDPDSQVRMAAVEALTGIGGQSSADWMSIALGDPDPRIRRTAVEALGEIGGDTAKFLLPQALQDIDPRVREAAEQMLAEPALAVR